MPDDEDKTIPLNNKSYTPSFVIRDCVKDSEKWAGCIVIFIDEQGHTSIRSSVMECKMITWLSTTLQKFVSDKVIEYKV